MTKDNIYEQKLPLSAKGFFTYIQSKKIQKNFLLLAKSEEEAVNLHQQLLFFSGTKTLVFYFPSFDTISYDRLSPSSEILAQRAKVLSDLARAQEQCIVITNAANISMPLPSIETIRNSSLELKVGMRLNAKNLIDYLAKNGFSRSPTAFDSGEFAYRGEIVDIIMPGKCAYRVNFSWDHIENIKNFDIDTQISGSSVPELKLNSASEIILDQQAISNFKVNYLHNFSLTGKNATSTTSIPLYEAITGGRKFPGFENLLPLFYDKTCSIKDFLQDPIIIYDNFCLQAIKEHIDSIHDLYRSKQQANILMPANYYPLLAPEKICLDYQSIKKLLNDQQNIQIIPENSVFAANIDLAQYETKRKTPASKIFEIIQEHRRKIPIICYNSKSNYERLKNLIAEYEYISQPVDSLASAEIGVINLAFCFVKQSFISSDYLFFAETDILPDKIFSVPKTARKLKNILTELDNIQEGELIVHNAHGIGQFLQIETIAVGGKPHDCLKILYAENARLYIPVENIDVLKKYGSGVAELDKLGNVSWQKRKSKLKDRIGNIAKELLRIVAIRKSFTCPGLEFKQELYDKFCQKFSFVETEDQLRAIEEIKEDLTSKKLMDRLICGDVGYGKTEVAMRAAFMVNSSDSFKDQPAQIVVVAPTTILAKQHFLRFQERFAEFGFNIRQLSRLVKSSEAKKVKQEIKDGTAHIIIGTHALLAKDIEFANLKMVIIDEEQHFGVGQKERLKQLKSGTHVLALSATPIPRTLQMSMVGLKDLSLIATPPLDRLPVRTTVMPYDGVILREALLREHLRGGRSFYVCPRISEITEIEKRLKQIVPELKYKVAHGGMPPLIVDEIMTDFYQGKFDILLSTTIIESGIDVASANTIIIHNADKLGLSQLYQLRGRVGRGKIRGYAYLTISNKISTKIASRRLEIMQSVDSLGAGFTIASHDMDLRGFGNLVGDEQSGHIKEVGVELYQEMLDEAIADLKGEHVSDQQSSETLVPSINLSLPVFIAEEYVADSSLRLALYRRLGDLKEHKEVEQFKDEMIDRFGPIPIEFNNLLEIVKIKHLCITNYIEAIDSGLQGFVIKFKPNDDISRLIFKFIQKYPRHTKMKPDNKLVVMRELKQENMLREINKFFNEFNS